VAANYKVNIELDTKKLDQQLRRLKNQVEEVGKVKRGAGGGGGKRRILSTEADDQFYKNLGIKTRQFAKSINPILNKADKVASKGGMLALPDSNMLNAQVKGIKRLETSADIAAKHAERKAKAEERSAKYATESMKANQASAKAGAAHARKLERMRGDTGFTAAQYGPQFDSMSLPTQSALNFDRRTGKLLRGPAGSSPNTLRNLGRRFDRQSALISGAFPLLFGQGPGVAAAGALGGGIGGMFGQMGGFAGGIAATAAVQAIQSAVQAIGDLGKALGPFTKNSQAAIEALGLQGSATEARIKLIEKAQGKNAAFNATMKLMANRVGEEGVQSITKFGETTRLLNNQFATGVARVQAFTASILNFLVKITGYEKSLRDADIKQTLSDARTLDEDPRAIALEEEKQKILENAYRTTGHGGSRKTLKVGAKEALDELAAREAILATVINTEIEVETMNQKFEDAVRSHHKQKELQERILELRKEGLNPEIAKTIAKLEQSAKVGKESIQAEIDKLLQLQAQKGELDPLEQARLTTLEDQLEAIDDQIDGIKKSEEATYNLNKAAEETLDAFDRMKTTIQTDIKDGIKGLIKGTSTLGDLLNNVADRFLDMALNNALFGNAGGSTVTGGLFGLLGFKANGGPVSRDKPYVVGERGPEIFTPGVSGNITPNHELGGSTNIVVNVDASGSSVEGDEDKGRELGRLISVAVQSEIIQQKRPGGLLA
jgi:hypothetical protein